MGQLDEGQSLTYHSRLTGNGSYIFVISGSLEIGGQTVGTRDGLGLRDFDQVNIKADANAEFLIMDVPMQ